MCGIAAYIGHQKAFDIIIKGLKRLEYRGYAIVLELLFMMLIFLILQEKREGCRSAASIGSKNTSGFVGIGHTRWATHGPPNDVNAHPHESGHKKFALVHNGIIENYATLKKELIQRGHKFHSDTDTEVLMHLIEDIHSNSKNKLTLFEAVRIALSEVIGAYAIVVINKDNPKSSIAARKSSPLVIGIGDMNFLSFRCYSDGGIYQECCLLRGR